MTSTSSTIITSARRRASMMTHGNEMNVMMMSDTLNDFTATRDTVWTDVLHVRDEIVDKAIQICYENYLEKQSIKFFVQCSYEAWMRILRLKFYSHDSRDEFYDPYPKFGPDKSPLPSIPDTWAANTVYNNDQQLFDDDEDSRNYDEENNIPQPQTSVPAMKGDHDSDVSHDSDPNEEITVMSNSDTSAKFQVQEEADDEIAAPNPSEVSSDAEDVEPSAFLSTTPSYFTSIATASAKRDALPFILSKIIPHKDRRSKQKLPKLKDSYVCNDKQHPRNIQLEDLPPVRAPTTFKYNVFTEEERKKNMEQKKKNK